MKQSKLNLQNFAGENILSREEMKNVLGGLLAFVADGDGGGCSAPITKCKSDSDCGGNCPKCCYVNSNLSGCATSCG